MTISILLIALAMVQCTSSTPVADANKPEQKLQVGAERSDVYLPLLQGKRVGIVVNHTSLVGETHLLDVLMNQKVNVKRIFVPEHGFRGDADAGALIDNSVDARTGIPIFSMYGKTKKPTKESLQDLDVLVFDMQDVGARFYTYISSLHYAMEGCAENGKKLIVLDRPNPNGDYFDGPVLEMKNTSFVGMHPIPVVHGLTIGELALMINGEKWLPNNLTCDLEIVKTLNYTHQTKFEPPVKPSPNLPNYHSIRLYPSICFFEATDISIGRGTHFPFQVIGYPDPSFGSFTFTPEPIKGMSMDPPQKGNKCYGVDLRDVEEQGFTLKYLIDFYKKWNKSTPFFARSNWMTLLSGTDQLEKQIKAGLSEAEIKNSWKPQLAKYGEMRKKYLLYPCNFTETKRF